MNSKNTQLIIAIVAVIGCSAATALVVRHNDTTANTQAMMTSEAMQKTAVKKAATAAAMKQAQTDKMASEAAMMPASTSTTDTMSANQ